MSSSVIDAIILSPTPAMLITSPTRSSETNLVPKPDTVVPEPAVETVPLSENDVSRTVSAEKSCPLSGSSMNTCLTLSNVLIIIVLIVKSAFELFSRISSVSADDVEISFSPVLKEPTTLINSISVLFA